MFCVRFDEVFELRQINFIIFPKKIEKQQFSIDQQTVISTAVNIAV